MFYFLFIFISVFTIFTFWFSHSSFREKAYRASILGLVLSFTLTLSLILYAWANSKGLLSGTTPQIIQSIVAIFAIFFTVALFIPFGRNPTALYGTNGMTEGNKERFNQKDTAFNIAHVGRYGPDVAKLRWSLQSQDPFDGIYWTLVMGLRNQVEGKVNSETYIGWQ